jgi:hypothetical protein
MVYCLKSLFLICRESHIFLIMGLHLCLLKPERPFPAF